MIHACSLVVLEYATDLSDSPIAYLARSYKQIWLSGQWLVVSRSVYIFCTHYSLSNQSSSLRCEMLGLAQIDSLLDRERFCVTTAYLEQAEGSILYVEMEPDMAGFSVRTHRGIYEIW